MQAQELGSVITAMATPFRGDGSLDLDGVQRLAAHLVATGTDTIVVNGTTGESPTLRGDEAWQVLAATIDAVGDDGLVMMGTGTNDTDATVAKTQRATEAGADAVLVVTPYYSRPSQAALVQHFTTVAEATTLPCMLYDVPSRTATEIALDTIVTLAQVDNIIGVKDAVANVAKTAEIVAGTRSAPGSFGVWSGADEVNLPVLAVGGTGFVSVAAHLVGPQLAEMARLFPSAPDKARDIHLALLPLCRALFAEPSPAPLKGALARLGLPAGPVRGPLLDASPAAVDAVMDALAVATAR